MSNEFKVVRKGSDKCKNGYIWGVYSIYKDEVVVPFEFDIHSMLGDNFILLNKIKGTNVIFSILSEKVSHKFTRIIPITNKCNDIYQIDMGGDAYFLSSDHGTFSDEPINSDYVIKDYDNITVFTDSHDRSIILDKHTGEFTPRYNRISLFKTNDHKQNRIMGYFYYQYGKNGVITYNRDGTYSYILKPIYDKIENSRSHEVFKTSLNGNIEFKCINGNDMLTPLEHMILVLNSASEDYLLAELKNIVIFVRGHRDLYDATADITYYKRYRLIIEELRRKRVDRDRWIQYIDRRWPL